MSARDGVGCADSVCPVGQSEPKPPVGRMSCLIRTGMSSHSTSSTRTSRKEGSSFPQKKKVKFLTRKFSSQPSLFRPSTFKLFDKVSAACQDVLDRSRANSSSNSSEDEKANNGLEELLVSVLPVPCFSMKEGAADTPAVNRACWRPTLHCFQSHAAVAVAC